MDYSMHGDSVRDAGSTSVLNIDDVRISKGDKSKPTHKTYLAALSIFLLIIAIIFAILFAVFFNKYISDDENKIKECTTPDCIRTASMLLDQIDAEADPCQDFSQFACGGFYKNTIIPGNEQYVDIPQQIIIRNSEDFRRILEEVKDPKDPSYVNKMKNFYQMCLDVDQRENVGVKPYTDSEFPKEWPTLNPDWSNSTFDLNSVIAKYTSRRFYDKNLLFSFAIEPDQKDSSKNVLQILYPELCISSFQLRSSPRNDSLILACERYYVDVALVLGADEDTARRDAKERMDLQIMLAQISNISETINTSNSTQAYNRMTLGEMTRDFPPIDWLRVFQAIFQTAGIVIDGNTTVINKAPDYFTSLKDVIKKTSDRALQNLFSFYRAEDILKDLTRSMRYASLDLNKHIKGITELDPRWRQCTKEVKTVFGAALAKQFVLKKFPYESKNYLETMIENLKTSFRGQLESTTWMGSKTKEAALRKLDAIKSLMGYPDKNFEDEYIDKLYADVTLTPGQFATNRIDLLRHADIAKLRRITRKVDRSRWREFAMDVNAYNNFDSNEIYFYAGILQPNFYSPTFTNSINYGSIGNVVGHELTHFFDNKGREYNEYGNVENWWQPQDLQNFQKRIQCLVDQYSAFHIPEIDEYLDGLLTVGENTADNGGIKAAFKAYKQLSATSETELPLPGLGLTLDQQFFVAFAQPHCTLHTNSDLKILLTDVHPPGRYRIIGTLRNNVEFSKAFNCPVGSPMNPIKKCEVW